MATSGEVAAIVAVLGTVFQFLGITGIDASLVNGAVNGVVSFVTIGAALWAWWKHKHAVAASAQQ